MELDRSAYYLQVQDLREWIFKQTGVQVQISIKRYPAVDPEQQNTMQSSTMTLIMVGMYLLYKRDVLRYMISAILQEPGAIGIIIVVSCEKQMI